MVAVHAAARPQATAVVVNERRISYGELDALAGRVAAALQAEGTRPGEAIAVCAASSIEYVALFIGALRAGLAVAPLAPGSTPQQLAGMVADSQAQCFFVDAAVAQTLREQPIGAPQIAAGRQRRRALVRSLAAAREPAAAAGGHRSFVAVQHHLFVGHDRHAQGHRAAARDALARTCSAAPLSATGRDAVTLISTPLYSNTTLVSLLPDAGARRHAWS